MPWLDKIVRAKRPQHVPVVLTREEVRAVVAHLVGVPRLMVLLLYGVGLRLLECARLRVEDVEPRRHPEPGRPGVRRMTGRTRPRAAALHGSRSQCIRRHVPGRSAQSHDTADKNAHTALDGRLDILRRAVC